MGAPDPRDKAYPTASEEPLSVERTLMVTEEEFGALKARARTSSADKAVKGMALVRQVIAFVRGVLE